MPRERGEIAGVFTRRLQLGMRLQTDPTVIYGMGEDWQGNIRRRLRRATLTIRIPLTAATHLIAMPGKTRCVQRLIKAGKSLYFVARGDGSGVFSNSLREHNRAVQQYHPPASSITVPVRLRARQLIKRMLNERLVHYLRRTRRCRQID